MLSEKWAHVATASVTKPESDKPEAEPVYKLYHWDGCLFLLPEEKCKSSYVNRLVDELLA